MEKIKQITTQVPSALDGSIEERCELILCARGPQMETIPRPRGNTVLTRGKGVPT